jgi:parallel beta-helix repeat protein
MNTHRFTIPLLLGLGLAAAWLLGAAWQPGVTLVSRAAAQPQTVTHYVAPTGSDGGVCTDSNNPCRTVQYAVDQAATSDEIHVATGVYTDLLARPAPDGYPGPAVITQAVYLSKTVTLRGGYSGDFTAWDPVSYPTTLDAMGQARVLFVGGQIFPTIEGLRLVNGDAAGLGGWIFGNSAGGGAYVITATATLTNVQVLTNTAYYGGGVFLYKSDGALRGSAIQNNTADMGGGGVYLFRSDNASVMDGLISENTGGSHSGGVGANESDFVILQGNTVRNNTAFSNGAGVSLDNCAQSTLAGNAIVSNTVTYGFGVGGGLAVFFSDPAMRGNVIQGNSAGKGGGGYFYHSHPTSINDAVFGNQAAIAGAAFYLEGSAANAQHATLSANSGGSGLYLVENTDFGYTASSIAMTNVILVYHTVGITVTGGNTATLDGVLWFGNTGGNYGGSGAISVTHAITGSPAFAADGYHITLASAALDNGVTSGVSDDIDGDARPQGAGYDLGADEIPPPPPTPTPTPTNTPSPTGTPTPTPMDTPTPTGTGVVPTPTLTSTPAGGHAIYLPLVRR